MKPPSLIRILILLPLAGCATSPLATSPLATISQDNFPVSSVSTTVYQKGQQIGEDDSPPTRRLAETPLAIINGQWTAKDATRYRRTGTYYGAQKHRWWSIEFSPRATARQTKAITEATNAYDAGLGWAINASLRICPRFERKTFSWGKAVSFLAQYQNDNTNYVPNNGMLLYEIHGLTRGGGYIRARFGVTHPGLAEFGTGVRDYNDGDVTSPSSPIRKDPHYKLVETAEPDTFEPSLTEIDRFLDTLATSG